MIYISFQNEKSSYKGYFPGIRFNSGQLPSTVGPSHQVADEYGYTNVFYKAERSRINVFESISSLF